MSRLSPSHRGGSQSPAARERIATAMVQLIGSQGYEATSVEMVCERARVEPELFERLFADKERCFLALHAQITTELCRLIHSAWEVPSSWHDRIWAAGWAAMRFIAEDALRTRFLLVEINGVGGAAAAHRAEMLGRLAALIDEGRAGLADAPGLVTRCSAEIVAGSIYRMVLDRVEAGAIDRGEEFLPELVYLAVVPYVGTAVAEQELQVEPLR